jgi:hypothetical protein
MSHGFPRWIRKNSDLHAEARSVKSLWRAVKTSSHSMPKTLLLSSGVLPDDAATRVHDKDGFSRH